MECMVCLCEYDSTNVIPRVLDCGHTFCEEDLKLLFKDKKIKCPQCNQFTKIKNSEQILLLRKNFAILQQTEDHAKQLKEVNQIRESWETKEKALKDTEE